MLKLIVTIGPHFLKTINLRPNTTLEIRNLKLKFTTVKVQTVKKSQVSDLLLSLSKFKLIPSLSNLLLQSPYQINFYDYYDDEDGACSYSYYSAHPTWHLEVFHFPGRIGNSASYFYLRLASILQAFYLQKKKGNL